MGFLNSRLRAKRGERREVQTVDITLGVYLEALFVAGVGEDDEFDPLVGDVSVETCRRLCGVLFERDGPRGFPREATDDALRFHAAAGWAALEATRDEALEWAHEERAILARLWGHPSGSGGLPLTDYLLRLGGDDDGLSALAWGEFLRLPLWQAFLFLYNRGVVIEGHRENAKLRRSLN